MKQGEDTPRYTQLYAAIHAAFFLMSEVAPAPPPPQAAPRATPWVDTFRGLAILEVVTHHASGMALRYVEAGSAVYLALLVLNRTLHFAVPAFLFVAAVLLARSLLRQTDWRRYFLRRVTRGAWPYVLWSGLYILW